MAISANVMNIETTEGGTTVITLSLPDFCHTITVPENYINGLPVIAAQPYGVIMVEDGAADNMPVVCMNNNKEFFSIALSDLMAADVHDTISFATPYVFPEDIDPTKYLAGLEDVEIKDLINGEILTYDSSIGKWKNSQDLFIYDSLPYSLVTEASVSFPLEFELEPGTGDDEGLYVGFIDERDIQEAYWNAPPLYAPVTINIDEKTYMGSVGEVNQNDFNIYSDDPRIICELDFIEQEGFTFKQNIEAETASVLIYIIPVSASAKLNYVVYNLIQEYTS